jgi:hypothetical protein
MVTQSLRGMANHGPMHWRGDRTGGGSEPSAEPDQGAFDEVAAFKAFNRAFVSLVGRDQEISDRDMQAFTEFILQVMYPPNPIRALDNTLSPAAAAGAEFFVGPPSLLGANLNCNGCHVENPGWNAGLVPIPGLFGGNGKTSFVFEPQHLKNVHLRNQYQKVGMFGVADQLGINPGDNDHRGDQVRGFGFFHDGSLDTVFRFLNLVPFNESPVGNPEGFPVSPEGDAMRRNVEAYMLEFETNFAPIVGQQVTLAATPSAAERGRADLLEARAELGECDLVVKMRLPDREAGFLYVGGGRFVPDRAGLGSLGSGQLRNLAAVSPLTYTAVPPGSGLRIGLDRDADGVLDGDAPRSRSPSR